MTDDAYAVKAREIIRRPCQPNSRDCVSIVRSREYSRDDPPPSAERCSCCPEHLRDAIAVALREAVAAETERCARVAETVRVRTESGEWTGSFVDGIRVSIATAIREANNDT